MFVILNGEKVVLNKEMSVFEFCELMNFQNSGNAFVLNGEVISNYKRDEAIIKNGDVVELITAMEGG